MNRERKQVAGSTWRTTFVAAWIGLVACASGCSAADANDSGDPGDDASQTDAVTATHTRYGSSTGGDTGSTIALVAPRIIRVYESGSPTSLRGQALTVPDGTPMHYSCKPDMVALGARDKTLIADLKQTIAAIPEAWGARVTIHHEFDNNGGADTPAVYQAGWKVFLSDVLAPVNAARKIKLISVAITTPEPYYKGTMDEWYVPGADEIGTDAYSSKAVQLAAAYAKGKGKPWSMPEYGYSVSVDGTDDEVLARTKIDHAFWTGVSNPPRTVIWYNANHNVLATRPHTAAYWKSITLN
jgi:hypothetical protein